MTNSPHSAHELPGVVVDVDDAFIDREVARFEAKPVLLTALALFSLEMALAGSYGFHRDELYFLDCARHLQWSYVDQPLVTPLLVRLSLSLFGVSLYAIRFWSALAVAATVVVGALLAREFGGARRAQIFSAVAVASMPVLLASGHTMGTTPIDILAWSALVLVVAKIGRTGNTRLWTVAGVITGLGVANKHSIGFLALAIAVGALISGGSKLVLNRWFLVGALVVALFASPDLWWQAAHGWPTIAMTRRLNQENGGLANSGNWVIGQLLMTSLAVLWVWIRGLKFLWRSSRSLWRSLVWAYAILFVFFAVTTGAKIYYLAGAYVYLVAAASVVLEQRWGSSNRRWRRLYGWTALTTVVVLPLVVPVLPAADIGWTYKINQNLAEEVGWPEMVHTVKVVWFSLTPRERSRAVIFTADYGEAGALNELGRRAGLPTAFSGQNSEWFWGPGPRAASTVVAVAPGPVDVTHYESYLRQFFRSVRVVATLTNHARLHNQEWHGHVYLCTGLKKSWFRTWPELRHYD
ncbi:MAG TPA: glycosyltransferase family 39 protein [Acidimicrobiales bacterium]|nr:glycosyltransferase family 39 protein [Acidimicrobiales bacterium]